MWADLNGLKCGWVGAYGWMGVWEWVPPQAFLVPERRLRLLFREQRSRRPASPNFIKSAPKGSERGLWRGKFYVDAKSAPTSHFPPDTFSKSGLEPPSIVNPFLFTCVTGLGNPAQGVHVSFTPSNQWNRRNRLRS